MAGRKLSAKAQEEVSFLENLLLQCDGMHKKIEEYATAKRGADAILQPITRQLSQMRQRAMVANMGPIADSAGMLAVGAARGSQMQRTRTLREGMASFKQLLERVIKATVDADVRLQGEKAREEEKKKEGAAQQQKPAGGTASEGKS